MMFAEVLVFQLGMYQGFTYKIPSTERVKTGDLVAVPFGRGNRIKKGLVLSVSDENVSAYKTKPILGKFPEAYTLTQARMKLLLWIRKEYFSPFYETARLFYPEYAFSSFDYYDHSSQKSVSEKTSITLVGEVQFFQLAIEEKTIAIKLADCEMRLVLPKKEPLKRAKIQRKIFSFLETKNNWIPVKDVVEKCQLKTPAIVRTMEKAGIVEIQAMDDSANLPLAPQKTLALTPRQESILNQIIQHGDISPILLHGITGSGKTEIYFHLIDRILNQGQSVLYLIPEIALTPQMIDRIKGRFNIPVAVLHSRLSPKERKTAWIAIRENQVSLILGTRSAMFAPIQDLGAVIVDECHDQSYHAQSSPRFRADEVAGQLGDLYEIPILFGSATPNFDQYYKGQSGVYHYLSLNERAQEASLPDVEVVDLREELKQGNRSMISRSLYENMKETLARKEQVILFLNRRGFSGFISCRACGQALKCTHCDVSLTYHHEDGSLRCHLCGRRFPRIKTCPNCGSTWLKPFSAGTQKLEAIVKKSFPYARVLRMDYDTTRSKESFKELYDAIKSGQCDIVIGTQMVAKGWDFPHVTLIGVLAADLSLHASRYDAADRTFQLLDQVSGRAGRSDKAGYVVLQTYTPEHYAIQAVADHDSTWFYRNEEAVRKTLNFPPFGHLLTIFGLSRREDQLEAGIKKARNFFSDQVGKAHRDQKIRVGEAIPSRIAKADGLYRKEFMVQIPIHEMEAFRSTYFNEIEIPLINLRSEGCQISILWNEEA